MRRMKAKGEGCVGDRVDEWDCGCESKIVTIKASVRVGKDEGGRMARV